MRILVTNVFLALLTPSAMAGQIDVGGTGKGDCDDRRGPNATSCLYFGNPYYNSATAMFTSNINPYYDPATGTFSSRAAHFAMLKAPGRVRRHHH